mmetsp:Transcript_2522/g.3379  ORF Transcript_2522/g.3379 Transcript_2522/m.3379 type:complete len:81 (-) Transcript_2522:62-304(-)
MLTKCNHKESGREKVKLRRKKINQDVYLKHINPQRRVSVFYLYDFGINSIYIVCLFFLQKEKQSNQFNSCARVSMPLYSS